MTPSVDIGNVTLTYRGGSGGVLALKDTSLTVGHGEFAAVVGPSGCGKSSLMKLVTGLVPPDSGDIVIFGDRVRGPVKIAGMAFQNPNLLPWRKVIDNVLLPLEIVQPHRQKFRREKEQYRVQANALKKDFFVGKAVVDDQSYKAGDQDFKAQLTAIKGKKPEAIYVPGYYTDVALVARQARELGIKVPLMGGDGWDSAKLYEIAKGALDGSFFSNHADPEDPSPGIQGFIAKYKKAYGAVPDALAMLGYDSAMVAADGMGRGKDLSGPAIAEALAGTKGFKGVTGVINLDADHNAVKSAVVIKIAKNAGKFAAVVNP